MCPGVSHCAMHYMKEATTSHHIRMSIVLYTRKTSHYTGEQHRLQDVTVLLGPAQYGPPFAPPLKKQSPRWVTLHGTHVSSSVHGVQGSRIVQCAPCRHKQPINNATATLHTSAPGLAHSLAVTEVPYRLLRCGNSPTARTMPAADAKHAHQRKRQAGFENVLRTNGRGTMSAACMMKEYCTATKMTAMTSTAVRSRDAWAREGFGMLTAPECFRGHGP